MDKLTIPGGWSTKPLRDVAKVVSGGTPSRYVPEFWEGGTIPWVTPTDITATTGRLLLKSQENITERGLKSCSAMLLPKGTLLMTSRATLGEIRIALGDVCTNQGFKSLVPINGTDGEFLYYQMLQNRDRYRSLGIGSTFLEGTKRDPERFEIIVAPRKEQRRIAEILSTIDQAIEQTEALIKKTQQIKAGLMHDLFTRGVLPNGQLRPPREQAPELYKESPLGWVPKEWESKWMRDISCVNQGLQIAISNRYKTPGLNRYRYITIQYLNNIKSESDTFFIEENNLSVICNEQDILLVRTGNTGQLITGVVGVFHNNFFKIVYDRTKLKRDYLTHFIRWEEIQKLIMNYAGTTTIPDLKHKDFYKLPVHIPAINEQNSILEMLYSIDEDIVLNNVFMLKLMKKKYGLMHDLLSGRVQVKSE